MSLFSFCSSTGHAVVIIMDVVIRVTCAAIYRNVRNSFLTTPGVGSPFGPSQRKFETRRMFLGRISRVFALLVQSTRIVSLDGWPYTACWTLSAPPATCVLRYSEHLSLVTSINSFIALPFRRGLRLRSLHGGTDGVRMVGDFSDGARPEDLHVRCRSAVSPPCLRITSCTCCKAATPWFHTGNPTCVDVPSRGSIVRPRVRVLKER